MSFFSQRRRWGFFILRTKISKNRAAKKKMERERYSRPVTEVGQLGHDDCCRRCPRFARGVAEHIFNRRVARKIGWKVGFWGIPRRLPLRVPQIQSNAGFIPASRSPYEKTPCEKILCYITNRLAISSIPLTTRSSTSPSCAGDVAIKSRSRWSSRLPKMST